MSRLQLAVKSAPGDFEATGLQQGRPLGQRPLRPVQADQHLQVQQCSLAGSVFCRADQGVLQPCQVSRAAALLDQQRYSHLQTIVEGASTSNEADGRCRWL